MKELNYKKIMYEIYRVDMKGKRNGYSSDSNYEYCLRKGITPYVKYKFDNKHEFIAHPGKGSVEISIYYNNKQIDTDSYIKRHKRELEEVQ